MSSSESSETVSVLIVGAGLSGLAAARHLQDSGADVLVLDKSRGVGGRCATRRFHDRRFDHGAQFFTVREPSFARLVKEWVDTGLVREWSRGFPSADGSSPEDGHPRYCGVAGMNAVPKALAEGLPIRTNERAVRAERNNGVWTIDTESGARFHAEKLILTAPLPQSLALLPEHVLSELRSRYPSIEAVEYERCFAVLLLLDGPSAVPVPGGLQFGGPDIAWLADNTMKGLDSGPSTLTVHSTPAFAGRYLESPHDEIAQSIISQCQKWLKSGVADVQVHRWLYSKPANHVGAPCITLEDAFGLLLCGDCMQAPSRVEGAFLSGLAAADVLLK